MPASVAAAALLLSLASSCTLNRSGAGTAVECRRDTDCESGFCVNGTCIGESVDSGRPEDSGLDSGAPVEDSGLDAQVPPDAPPPPPDSGPPPGPLLDYAEATFTRGSVATWFDPATGTLTRYAAHEPRILADGSIYVEGERTNFVLDSEAFESWFTDDSTVTANLDVAPDGARTAERWVALDDGGARAFLLGGPWGGASRPTATISIFAAAPGGSETFRQYWRGAGTHQFGEDRTVGAGWERFTVTREDMERNGVAQATTAAARMLSIWGAQAEEGHFASQYIPTAGLRETRAADTVVFGAAPAGMTSGPWTVELAPGASSEAIVATGGSWTVFEFGSIDESVRLRVGAGAVRVSVRTSGSPHVETMPLTFDAHQVLTVSVDPSAGRLTVAGASSGNGTTSASAWTFPAGPLRVGSGAPGLESYFGAIGRPSRGGM